MAWQEGTATTTSAASGTAASLATPAAAAAGRVCAVCLCFDGTPGTITPPDGFTPIADSPQFPIYWKILEGDEGPTLDFSWVTPRLHSAIAHVAWEDRGGVHAFDDSAFNTATTGTSHTTGSVDAARSNSFLFAFYMFSVIPSTTTWTATGGLTKKAQVEQSTTRCTSCLCTEVQAFAGASGGKTATTDTTLSGVRDYLLAFNAPAPATGQPNALLMGVG